MIVGLCGQLNLRFDDSDKRLFRAGFLRLGRVVEGGNQGAKRMLVSDIRVVYGSDKDTMVLSPALDESTR